MGTIKKIIVIIFGLNLLIQVFSFAQGQTTIMVKDEDGNPISEAQVLILGDDDNKKGKITTNENGEFVIPNGNNILVYIEADGYESKQTRVFSAVDGVVELTKMPYQMSEKDYVFLPFDILKQRQIPGGVNTIDPVEILKYDEQNGIGGLLTGRVTGLFGSLNIRGIGSPLVVINGIPGRVADINPREIKQITIVKDISTAMLYGPQAHNGVILITTKRGSMINKGINFTLEYGVNDPIDYPDYLSAADYMELYNEASVNDGLDPRYSNEAIQSTRTGVNPIQFPDESYYNSTFLKDFSNYQNFNAEIIKGNEIGKFFLNLGWNRSTGLLNIGEGSNEKNDRFNVRTAIDYGLTDKIDFSINGSAIFENSKGPRYSSDNFWELSTTFRPNLYPLLIPTSLLDDYPELVGQAKIIEDQYLLGGTSEYLTNIYGDFYLNGAARSYNWLMNFNTGLFFDLSGITEGLQAKTVFAFENYSFTHEEKQNSYAVYSPDFSEDALASISKLGVDVNVHNQTVTDGSYYKRFGFQGIVDYKRVFGKHKLDANAIAYMDMYTTQTEYQPLRYGHIGLRANYMFSNKYIAELTGVFAGSGKYLDTENMYSFSPGIGLGWILTEENFMKDNSLIDYLKIRSNWSILNTDENVTNYNIGRNYYTASGTYVYENEGSRNVGRVFFPGNTNLKWEKVTNFNLGFESMLFNYKLGVEANYFYYKNYDLIVRRVNTLPAYFGNLAFDNYGSNQRQGVELGVNHSMDIGDITLDIGANFVYSTPKLLAGDERLYPDEYRRRVGKATDGRWGYVALGLFKDQADIDGSPLQLFGDVQPGDIKYEDLNSDGVIDEDDQKMIGNSSARMDYGFNVKLKYKTFELFALGTGQVGRDSHFSSPYYWVNGNVKYSEIVWDRWTPETADIATYPRLSTMSGPNNFRTSTFWQYEDNWFKIHTIQLNYAFPGLSSIGLNEIRFFIKGNNLIKFSKIKEKTNLNVGSAPQMRTISLGLNFTF